MTPSTPFETDLFRTGSIPELTDYQGQLQAQLSDLHTQLGMCAEGERTGVQNELFGVDDRISTLADVLAQRGYIR